MIGSKKASQTLPTKMITVAASTLRPSTSTR